MAMATVHRTIGSKAKPIPPAKPLLVLNSGLPGMWTGQCGQEADTGENASSAKSFTCRPRPSNSSGVRTGATGWFRRRSSGSFGHVVALVAGMESRGHVCELGIRRATGTGTGELALVLCFPGSCGGLQGFNRRRLPFKLRSLEVTVRTFVDPEKTSPVGLVIEVPDMETFQKAMESEAAADAMKFDGVRRQTLMTLVEPEHLTRDAIPLLAGETVAVCSYCPVSYTAATSSRPWPASTVDFRRSRTASTKGSLRLAFSSVRSTSLSASSTANPSGY